MGTTLVIPDIHQNHIRAQQIIDAEPHDRVVFLGDYWDMWDDTPADAAATAVWLDNRMAAHPEDEFLIGNHDVQYLWFICPCSGFSVEKQRAIVNAASVKYIRARMKMYTLVDGWLMSHAGFTAKLLKGADLPATAAECMDNLFHGQSHRWLEAGRDRGGHLAYGGPVWCDWRRFEITKGVKQLVGHTPDYSPRSIGDNHCIDVIGLNAKYNLRAYAVIEDGRLTVKATPPG